MKKKELFSYFKKGVTATEPFEEHSLEFIYLLIKSFKLKEITQKIREGKADKTKVLPSVTFSGTFIKRCISGLKDWSSLIVMDLDKLDFPETLKDRIARDTFLNPALMFISPRGKGLKIVVRIEDGVKKNHVRYFQAIAHYLKGAYGLKADASGSDWSRLCFLCYDADVYYNPDGFVTSEALLKLLPKPAATATATATAPNSYYWLTPIFDSSSIRAIRNDDKPSDRLNKMPQIHDLAVSALERSGWKPKGDLKGELWIRPGKELREGHSAKYNIWGQAGIWFFTCFSNNAFPFKENKGYTDVQIICLLNFSDDWTACISELASRYLEPV